MNVKKQFKFLYRYFTTSQRWRRILRGLVNRQTLMILVPTALFLVFVAWSAARPAPGSAKALAVSVKASAAQALAQPALTQTPGARAALPTSTPTRTPFPPEYFTNANEGIGITLVGAALVLIVVIGVMAFLPKNGKDGKL